MTYEPRIYIRDYPQPTIYSVARSGAFVLTGYDSTTVRHLISTPLGPDTFLVLLSGDMQSGTDHIALSGDEAGNVLMGVQQASGRFVLTGYPAAAAFGVTQSFPDTGAFIVTGNDVVADYSGELYLSGDMQGGSDALRLSGDMQSDADVLLTSISGT